MIYILTFLVSSTFIWIGTRECTKRKMEDGMWETVRLKKIPVLIGLLLPALLASMRAVSVGSDVSFYVVPLFNKAINSNSFSYYVAILGGDINDIGYCLLNYIISRFTTEIGWLFFATELIIVFFTFAGCWKLRGKAYPWLSIASSEIPVEALRDSKVLVTGATGLIGVSLVRALLCVNRVRNLNLQVLALIRNKEKAEKIYKELLNREDLVLLLGDVTEKISARQKVDYIFHCASVTASKVMINNPVETLLTSIDGTKNVLNFARESSCKSVVYVSSMEMYGSFAEANNNVTETELGYINPLAVRSNYPESKRLCENMCVAFWSEYGVPVKIARLSQTFGAGILSGENRVFAQFARSAIEGKDIVLHTRGLSEGNYCYTRDTIMGLFLILIKGENAEAYNVTNPETHTTIVDMARMVCQKFGNGKIKVVFDIPESNKFGYAADTKMKLNADKLKNLGWRPEIGLEEAYRRMIMGMKRECEG